MLNKKKQHKYINKRCETMLNCVSKFCENKDHEELHKLRVETKKLKAYAVFTSKLTGKKFKRDLAPVTGIFKKAGEIRTAQLNLATVKKYRIRAPGFKKAQIAMSANVTQQFVTSSARYLDNIRSVCKSIQDDCQDIGNKKILKFYSKKLDSLSFFFRENFDEKNLHAKRKIIKILVYADNLLPRKIKQELALNTPYFDALQDTAGKWHDAIVMLDVLHNIQIDQGKKDQLAWEKDKLLQAVKLMATHFEKNLSIKKTIYTGP